VSLHEPIPASPGLCLLSIYTKHGFLSGVVNTHSHLNLWWFRTQAGIFFRSPLTEVGSSNYLLFDC